MSVWKAAIYRDDALQKLMQFFVLRYDDPLPVYLASLCNYDIEQYGSFPVELKVGDLREQVIANPKLLADIYDGPRRVHCVKVWNLIKSLPETYFGLPAVYRVFNKVRKKRDRRLPDLMLEQDIFKVGMIVGGRTPKDAVLKCVDFEEEMKNSYIPEENVFYSLLKIGKAHMSRGHMTNIKHSMHKDDVLAPLKHNEVKILGAEYAWNVAGLLIIQYKEFVATLTQEDIVRIENLVKGHLVMRTYVEHQGVYKMAFRQQVRYAFEEYFSMIIEAGARMNMREIQWLCRAADVVYNIFLAGFASDLDTVSLDAQMEKFTREGLDKLIDLERVKTLLAGIPVKQCLEVLLLYKCLPQPDFDYYGAMHRQVEMWKQQREIKDRNFLNSILLNYKLLAIRSYYAVHHFCPGKLRDNAQCQGLMAHYPHVNPDKLSPSDCDLIDLTASFVYRRHGSDIMPFVKDKAICPASIRGMGCAQDVRDTHKHHKNQLLDVLFRDDHISIDELYPSIPYLWADIKAEDKPEAKKPYGRLFFEAHTDMRLALSEYEFNVAEYCRHIEGYMLGKGIIDKVKMMNHVTGYAVEADDMIPVYISFDIEKFSPTLPIEVHRLTDGFWSNAFGMPDLANMIDIFTRGDVHYVKRRVHHTVHKMNADYEGFSGKKLTLWHLAIMHAAMGLLRAKGIIIGAVRYACQIDDGVMRVAMKKSTLGEKLPELRKELEDIWLGAGLKISWDKTFISGGFAVFLNELRYNGRQVAPGIKAMLKMTQRSETIVACLPDEFATAEATARAACIAGTAPSAAYMIYSHLCADSIRKWRGKHVDWGAKQIIQAFGPVALGGLGLKTVMAISSELEKDALRAGISQLKELSYRLKSQNISALVDEFLTQPLRKPSSIGSVSSPYSVRREGPILRTDRAMNKIRDNLLVRFTAQVQRLFGVAESSIEAAHLVSFVSSRNQLPDEVRQIWWDSTLMALYDALTRKILTGRTASSFVNRTVIRRISAANASEAKIVLSGLAC